MNDIDKEYYVQMHETARTYQTNQWAIPAAFVALQALTFGSVEWENFESPRTVIILLFNAIFCLLLSIVFIKTYLLGSLIHKKIDSEHVVCCENCNNTIKKYMPLYSMPFQEFLRELHDMDGIDNLDFIQKSSLKTITTQLFYRIAFWFSVTLIIISGYIFYTLLI